MTIVELGLHPSAASAVQPKIRRLHVLRSCKVVGM